jgi:hypothetical protein
MTACAIRRTVVGAVLAAVLIPNSAAAQGDASITGVIRDASGAVLPGVTVEARSPALIEKQRVVVSDGTGQYRIVSLGPGVYSVTFTLPGFSTLVRDGIELRGSFTATVNAELTVGAVEESVSVSGLAPIVDVQSTTKQRVISADIIDAVPSGMYYANIGTLIAGVSVSCAGGCTGTAQDVGGSAGDTGAQLVAHGSRFRDQRMFVNGVSVSGATGGVSQVGPNMPGMQEVQIDTSGADAQMPLGGVRINMIPKDGGNRFNGEFFLTGTSGRFQSGNVDQALIARGVSGVPKLKKLFDMAAGFGGPIKQDRLWFFVTGRVQDAQNYKTVYANLFGNDRTQWQYVPDPGKPLINGNPLRIAEGRLTMQVSARNKVTASFNVKTRCNCPMSTSNAPEASAARFFSPSNQSLITWSSPVTNRLLLEAGAAMIVERSNLVACGSDHQCYGNTTLAGVQVIEQSPPPSYLGVTTYHGVNGFPSWSPKHYTNTSFAVTYVTGAHAFKAGLNHNWGDAKQINASISPLTSYTFTRGVPTSFAVNSDPTGPYTNIPLDFGAFVQDKWTHKRMTVSGGLRFDAINAYAPEQHYGPAPLLPNRDITFPKTDFTGLRDLNPRLGFAIDVFGTGKTAVKASLNRYVQDRSLSGVNNLVIGSPVSYYQTTATRAWTDSNGNFYPDCDWANGAAQNLTASGGDICGAWTGASANFGKTATGTVNDREVDFGWGNRQYNWEYSTSVQQELVPGRIAIDVGYYRRWFGNFNTTDNLTTAASDYGRFSVVVPTDPRLPLSGQAIGPFFDPNANVASLPSNNHVMLADNFGRQFEYWHGVDATTAVRLSGAVVQGGYSTGRRVTDNCEIVSKVPETSTVLGMGALLNITGPLVGPFCHQEEQWQHQFKMFGTYMVPRIAVQFAAAFQSIPGPMLTATLPVPSATVQTIGGLGRPLAGNAANVTVNVIEPGSLYGDRLNQIDLRVGKVISLGGGRRATASVDLFNVLNSNAVLLEATTYAAFRTPVQITPGRLVKFTLVASF